MMNKQTFIKLLVGLGLALAATTLVHFIKQTTPSAEFTLGILKTVSHPALDLVEAGFIEVVKDKLGNRVAFIQQNADGSILQATHIANNFHANKALKGVLAIATPAALALCKTEKEKPLFIGAVTDPQSLGLLDEGNNVCGCSDMIDVRGEIDMLTKLLPHAQTIALIFNPSEPNSCIAADLMIAELTRQHKTVTVVELQNESEIVPTTTHACAHADALLAPTDNLVASSIATIAACARKAGKPLIVSDNALVPYGALAARGVDYREVGRRTGHCALEVLLEGKKPHDLPINTTSSSTVHINKAVLSELGIELPASLDSAVVMVDDRSTQR